VKLNIHTEPAPAYWIPGLYTVPAIRASCLSLRIWVRCPFANLLVFFLVAIKMNSSSGNLISRNRAAGLMQQGTNSVAAGGASRGMGESG